MSRKQLDALLLFTLLMAGFVTKPPQVSWSYNITNKNIWQICVLTQHRTTILAKVVWDKRNVSAELEIVEICIVITALRWVGVTNEVSVFHIMSARVPHPEGDFWSPKYPDFFNTNILFSNFLGKPTKKPLPISTLLLFLERCITRIKYLIR